ncbi:hypothetical protein TNCV_4832721, partial [Trichonephila clavipes]
LWDTGSGEIFYFGGGIPQFSYRPRQKTKDRVVTAQGSPVQSFGVIFRSTGINACCVSSGDKGPVVSRPYKYDRVKQGIIDYHIDKMLRDGTICPVNSPYASPVVLTERKMTFLQILPRRIVSRSIGKLNGITKYPAISITGY